MNRALLHRGSLWRRITLQFAARSALEGFLVVSRSQHRESVGFGLAMTLAGPVVVPACLGIAKYVEHLWPIRP